MTRRVHAEGMRERRARGTPRDAERVHRCRALGCGAEYDSPQEVCSECGYSDPHSTHGATQREVAR